MTTEKRIRIFIADDHPVFRKGLREVIEEESHYDIIGETGNGDRVVDLVQQFMPDVLLLDLNMPGVHGLDIATQLRDQKIPVKIIVLTMHKEEALCLKALDLGVEGYVIKDSAVHDIMDSIRAVIKGEYYISPAIAPYLVKRRKKSHSLHHGDPGLDVLTATERKILKLISEYKTSKDIAAEMFISTRTVENHRMNICKKLAIHGSNALLKFALEHKFFL